MKDVCIIDKQQLQLQLCRRRRRRHISSLSIVVCRHNNTSLRRRLARHQTRRPI